MEIKRALQDVPTVSKRATPVLCMLSVCKLEQLWPCWKGPAGFPWCVITWRAMVGLGGVILAGAEQTHCVKPTSILDSSSCSLSCRPAAAPVRSCLENFRSPVGLFSEGVLSGICKPRHRELTLVLSRLILAAFCRLRHSACCRGCAPGPWKGAVVKPAQVTPVLLPCAWLGQGWGMRPLRGQNVTKPLTLISCSSLSGLKPKQTTTKHTQKKKKHL